MPNTLELVIPPLSLPPRLMLIAFWRLVEPLTLMLLAPAISESWLSSENLLAFPFSEYLTWSADGCRVIFPIPPFTFPIHPFFIPFLMVMLMMVSGSSSSTPVRIAKSDCFSIT